MMPDALTDLGRRALTAFSPWGAGGPRGTLYVLLVEDNAVDAELLSALLEDVRPNATPSLRIRSVERLADARRVLDDTEVDDRIDVVLLDLSLPDGDGLG